MVFVAGIFYLLNTSLVCIPKIIVKWKHEHLYRVYESYGFQKKYFLYLFNSTLSKKLGNLYFLFLNLWRKLPI